ncbi:hypothetical protein K523DRAFT_26408, partial [Schizophyllum commune Tattone D]
GRTGNPLRPRTFELSHIALASVTRHYG